MGSEPAEDALAAIAQGLGGLDDRLDGRLFGHGDPTLEKPRR